MTDRNIAAMTHGPDQALADGIYWEADYQGFTVAHSDNARTVLTWNSLGERGGREKWERFRQSLLRHPEQAVIQYAVYLDGIGCWMTGAIGVGATPKPVDNAENGPIMGILASVQEPQTAQRRKAQTQDETAILIADASSPAG